MYHHNTHLLCIYKTWKIIKKIKNKKKIIIIIKKKTESDSQSILSNPLHWDERIGVIHLPVLSNSQLSSPFVFSEHWIKQTNK
jgi:hypothetical protein